MNIDFHAIEESNLISYKYYVTQVSNHDLRELNGFKVRNILSLAFNFRIRELILDALFNKNNNLLTVETKDNFKKYLSSDEINELKELISNYLFYQIESSWYQKVCHILNETNIETIVVSSFVLDNKSILNELKDLFPRKKFTDWRGISATSSALFLDYNHSWKKINIFNMQENTSRAIFLKHFFENVYKRRVYNDEKQIFEAMDLPLRKQLFGDDIITELKNNLETLKPLETYNEWDYLHETDDRNYYNSHEEIIIHHSINRTNKYRLSSSLLLFREEKYSIASAKDILLNPPKFENNYHISLLDNIIDNIDLNEINKAIDKDDNINLIIQPLWERFNLYEKDGPLWKQLLKWKVQVNGLLNVYSEIERISEIQSFVGLNTFENTYCNPSSDTIIPREKRVFKAICRYLELPLEYRVAIHRERILIGGHSQELHMKLKPLIESIVNLGILDVHQSDDKLLEIMNEVIEKIEEKVDMDYFGFTKDTLSYACIALCYEIVKKMRLKPILKIEHIIPN